MVVLVRCADNTYTVALSPMVEALANEGLVTAYLGPNGWVEVEGRPKSAGNHQAISKGRRYHPHWQIKQPASLHQPASPCL